MHALALSDLPLIQQRILQDLPDDWTLEREAYVGFDRSGRIHLDALRDEGLIERRGDWRIEGYHYRRTPAGRALCTPANGGRR